MNSQANLQYDSFQGWDKFFITMGVVIGIQVVLFGIRTFVVSRRNQG